MTVQDTETTTTRPAMSLSNPFLYPAALVAWELGFIILRVTMVADNERAALLSGLLVAAVFGYHWLKERVDDGS